VDKSEAKHVKAVRECLLDMTGDDNWSKATVEGVYSWCGIFEFESAEDDANALLSQGVEPHHCGVEV
jgi:hypothetical protein